MNKWILRIVWLAVFAGGGYWLYQRYSQPLVGEVIVDQGREHVTDIFGVTYTSNPPTSGPHFVVWAKGGIYERVISDGHLIHSLEHGYVVISYDCTKLATGHWPLATSVYAHEDPVKSADADNGAREATEGSVLGGGAGVVKESSPSAEATDSASSPQVDSGKPLMHLKIGLDGKMSAFTPENAPAREVELPQEFRSDGCKQLVGQVSEFYNRNKTKRLVVVPRAGMETTVALTAWNRILKLSSWDEIQAKLFLDQWENKGPEKTVE